MYLLKKYFLIFFAIIFLFSEKISSNDLLEDDFAFTYSEKYGVSIKEFDYIELISSAVIIQPEYKLALANRSANQFDLNYAKSDRFPTITSSLRNDYVLDRKVTDINSIRKIQDDSLDAIVEINQSIYAGGKLNASVAAARNYYDVAQIQISDSTSKLVMKANQIYLQAMYQAILLNYIESKLDEINNIVNSIRNRVEAGISQPEDLALTQTRSNNLSITRAKTKADLLASRNAYLLFFKKPFELSFIPKISLKNITFEKTQIKSYSEQIENYKYLALKEEIAIARSPYLPNFGFNVRYIQYDLNKDADEFDLKGGIYFSLPIFNFGRGKNAVSAARAKAQSAMWTKQSVMLEESIKKEVMKNTLLGLLDTRKSISETLSNTLKTEEILRSRMAGSNYSAVALSELILEEVGIFSNLLQTEIEIFTLDLEISHINTTLLSRFKIGI